MVNTFLLWELFDVSNDAARTVIMAGKKRKERLRELVQLILAAR